MKALLNTTSRSQEECTDSVGESAGKPAEAPNTAVEKDSCSTREDRMRRLALDSNEFKEDGGTDSLSRSIALGFLGEYASTEESDSDREDLDKSSRALHRSLSSIETYGNLDFFHPAEAESMDQSQGSKAGEVTPLFLEHRSDDEGPLTPYQIPPATSATHTPVGSPRSCGSGRLAPASTSPASFAPQRRLFFNPISSRYGQIRGLKDDTLAQEEARVRARLATSPPPSPTIPPQAPSPPITPIEIANRMVDNSSASAVCPSANSSPTASDALHTTPSPILHLHRETTSDRDRRSESPGFEMVGQRRAFNGEDKIPKLEPDKPQARPQKKGVAETDGTQVLETPAKRLTQAAKGLTLDKTIEIVSTTDTGASAPAVPHRPFPKTSTAIAVSDDSDSDGIIEVDPEGLEVIRTPGSIGAKIHCRAVVAMPKETAHIQGHSPLLPRYAPGDDSRDIKRKKDGKKLPVSPTKKKRLSSSAFDDIIKKGGGISSDDDDFNSVFGYDKDSESVASDALLAGGSTPTKPRRRPHNGPRRTLPLWAAWEDLMITHHATNGKLGSCAGLLEKINARRTSEELETRVARDIHNRWTTLKATMEASLAALHRQP